VETTTDGSIDCTIEGRGLSTTQAHVGDGTLVGLVSLSSGLCLCLGSVEGKFDTIDNVGHGSATIAAENLDSNDVGLLRDTVLARSNGTGTVSSVTVTVLVDIVLGDGLTPRRATFELGVVNVDTGVDDVNINAFATIVVVQIPVEGTEAELLSVTDASETL